MPEMRERRDTESGKSRGKQQAQCKECKKKFITERHYSKDLNKKRSKYFTKGTAAEQLAEFWTLERYVIALEPVHIKIASKIRAKVTTEK